MMPEAPNGRLVVLAAAAVTVLVWLPAVVRALPIW